MATKGTEIHALEQKIRIIAETLYELGSIRNPSRREFATFAQISYDRLKAAWSSGRLSVTLEKKIVAAGGFDQSDPAWSDQSVPPMNRSRPDNPEYLGRDTAENFRDMLRHRLGVAPDIVRVVDERPRLLDSNLITFAFSDSGQGAALGQPTPLFLTIVLEPGYHPSGFIYGFRRIRLRLRFSEKSAVRMKRRLGCEKAVEIGAAILTVRGDEHHSEWFLQAETIMLQGEFTTRDDPLCSLIGFGIDERFEAEISVRPLDGSLVDQDGSELAPINKRRIVELLFSKKLSDAPDSQGWISLGIQTLRIVRGDRA